MSLVEITDADGVRTITVNRPDAYNSLNRDLRLALIEAFTAAAEDSATGGPVRTVVLQAAGKAFCSGQDLKEQLVDAREGTGSTKVVEEYNPMMAALLSIPVPVIAAVQGPAAGAGWG
jgi:2-(1,2-epoxy-1,2-dihydrophenyl)acetyl-CoA isomerase